MSMEFLQSFFSVYWKDKTTCDFIAVCLSLSSCPQLTRAQDLIHLQQERVTSNVPSWRCRYLHISPFHSAVSHMTQSKEIMKQWMPIDCKILHVVTYATWNNRQMKAEVDLLHTQGRDLCCIEVVACCGMSHMHRRWQRDVWMMPLDLHINLPIWRCNALICWISWLLYIVTFPQH